jgi:hypothetical protein
MAGTKLHENPKFTVRGELSDGAGFSFGYLSVVEAREDEALYTLFVRGFIKRCHISKKNNRVSRDVCTWEDLDRQLVNNSPILLK